LATARVCETLNPSNLSGVPKRRSESSVINAGRSQPFTDHPMNHRPL
jgi:hypothetical protein